MRYGCSPTSSRNRIPPSTSGKYGVPTRCATIARLPPHSIPSHRCAGPSSAHSIVHSSFSSTPKQFASVNGDGACAPKSYDAIGPAYVTIPALSRAPQRSEVEPVDETRKAIAAAKHQCDVRVGIGRDAGDGREPLVV